MEGLNYFATKTQSFRSNVKQRHKKQWKVSTVLQQIYMATIHVSQQRDVNDMQQRTNLNQMRIL